MRKHIHQYQKKVIGKNKYPVYACVLSGCTHYIAEDLAIGKQCICNRCKEAVCIIKRASNGKPLHKPHCDDCTQSPRNPALRRSKKRTKLGKDFASALLGDP